MLLFCVFVFACMCVFVLRLVKSPVNCVGVYVRMCVYAVYHSYVYVQCTYMLCVGCASCMCPVCSVTLSLSFSLSSQRESFHPEYFTCGTMIVAATLDVYKETMSSLLPTPAKSHYVFNLRDFARVVLGCLLVKSPSIESKKQFIRLWVHEVYRVYYDRLVDDKDRLWLFDLMQKMVKQHFKDDFQNVFKHLSSGSKVTDDNMRSLLFGDYIKPDAVSLVF